MGCVQQTPNFNETDSKKIIKEQLVFGMSDFVHEMQGNITTEYELIWPSLGKGSFGEVFKAIHIKTGLQRAVKTVSKSKLKVNDQRFLQNEVENLKKLDHPNILKVYEFYQDKDYLYIVTELCTGGELFDRILENKSFSENTSGEIMKQILSAIKYCHKNGIVHRDLKPENIIFQSKTRGSTLKIIDFGAAREYRYEQCLSQKIGTPYYISPEVLFGEYNEKCDVWSCGVILYIMLTGVPPFSGKDDKNILLKVSKGLFSLKTPQFREISFEAKDLLSKMMEIQKDKRLSADECLKHPWFTKVTDTNIASKTALVKALSNLTSFKTRSKLQYATWMYLVNVMATKQQKKELLKTFQTLDVNQNGQITLDQLITGLRTITPPQQHQKIQQKMQVFYQQNCKHPITFNEFVMYSINRKAILMDSNLEKVFRLFDKDDSKAITVGELKEILGSSKSVSLRVWKQLMKEADSNSDGSISLDQFKDMMKAILKGS